MWVGNDDAVLTDIVALVTDNQSLWCGNASNGSSIFWVTKQDN